MTPCELGQHITEANGGKARTLPPDIIFTRSELKK